MAVTDSLTVEQIAGLDGAELDDALVALTAESRRLTGLMATVISRGEETRCYRSWGHRTSTGWVAGSADMSRLRAGELVGISHACRDMPYLHKGLLDSTVGVEQAAIVGRLHRNSTIRPQLPEWDEQITGWAQTFAHPEFKLLMARFEAVADPDGQLRDEEISHERRGVTITRSGASWELRFRTGALQGDEYETILAHFAQIEFERDWEAAKAVHGDDTAACHLARTARQRRADAMMTMARSAKAGDAAIADDPSVTIVADPATVVDAVMNHYGLPVTPLDPARMTTRRAETLSGTQLTLPQLYAAIAIGRITTMMHVPGTRHVELGRLQRFHNAAMRHAISILDRFCTQPGCHLSSQGLHIDHAEPASEGGTTGVTNGDPRCGPDNRSKHEHHLKVVWNPVGRWDTYTADGRPVGPHAPRNCDPPDEAPP